MGTDKADLVADEELDPRGQKGWLAQAARHEVKHGREIAGIVLAMAQVGLLAGQLDLVGVEKEIVHSGMRLTSEGGRKVVHEGPRPRLVVDAGGFVAQEHPVKAGRADQGIDEIEEATETGRRGGELEWADEFLTGGGEGRHPVDVLADVQQKDQDTVIADPGQALAEDSDTIGVVAFQVMQALLDGFVL